MKKAFIVILLSFVSLFALDDLTVPNRFESQGVIRASEFNQNNDTISVKFNRLNDSLEIKFVRFSDFSDSTIKKIKVDSIRSNPDIDSIKGNPFIDSISSLFANLTTSTIDSLNNRIIIADTIVLGNGLSAETGAFSGVINADTVHSTKGISATKGNFSSYINADSLKSTKGISATTGTFSGIVSADSIASTKGISGTIGNFSGSVSVGSISISDGVSTTTGTFTGVVNVDTLKSTKGISATKGNFSSYINVDSLKSTKGISATTGTFTGDVVSSGDIYSTGLTDISSSCEVIGWDTLTTKSIYYRKVGKEVTVYYDLKGTAHASVVSASIYSIPLVTSSTITKAYANCYAKDSSGVLTNAVAKVESFDYEPTSYIDFYIDYAQSRAWPRNGEKEVYGSITFLAEE
jgi:hypothetical protein